MVSPIRITTSGVFTGVPVDANTTYDNWIKWVWPFMIILVILGFLLLFPTQSMKMNGF